MMTTSAVAASADEPCPPEVIDAELTRIERRRAATSAPSRPESPQAAIGLALSGGGIRSATLSLGVLQSLARRGLLEKIDYLSTVSGGGYMGCYFASLFVPPRLRNPSAQHAGSIPGSAPPGKPLDGAARHGASPLAGEFDAQARIAWQTLAGPEERSGSDGSLMRDPESSGWTGAKSLTWLRDNGRYLAPKGAGDFIYAIALQIRNWVAIQYVIAIALLAPLLVFAAVRAWLILASPAWRDIEEHFLPGPSSLVYWSPGWAIAAAQAVVSVIPAGLAYWLVDSQNRNRERLSWIPLIHQALILALAALALRFDVLDDLPPVRTLVIVYFAIGAIAVLLFFAALAAERAITPAGSPVDLKSLRTRLTRWLKATFQLFLFSAGFALIASLGQTVYAYLSTGAGLSFVFGSSSLAGVLVVVGRYALRFINNGKSPGRHAALSTDAIAGIAAVLLFAVIGTLWALLAQTGLWLGQPPLAAPVDLQPDGSRQWVATALSEVGVIPEWTTLFALVAVFLFVTTGRFLNFLNASTLQLLYAARITRAYLGASNPQRFADPAKQDVTNPLPGDAIPLAVYYHPDIAAPLHLINVTVNQTRPQRGKLVQRDRKGVNMAVGPGFTSVGASFFARNDGDGSHTALAPGRPQQMSEKLDVGDWCGISGAAFSTGMGMKSSLGLSLLAGLANLRLGYWWNAYKPRLPDPGRFFAAYRYLWSELMADFRGRARPYWFLTDGGHFDNTAVYELVRRRVGLIVLCDNGCDPDYRFEDLGNLSRLVRTDFGAVMEEVPLHEERVAGVLGQHAAPYALPGEFRHKAGRRAMTSQCALLYTITYPRRATAAAATAPDRSLLLVLKPRLVDNAPLDVRNYGWTHPDFPQQSTSEQFFDDAQWESYRQLGERIADLALSEDALRFDGWRLQLGRDTA